MVIVRPLAASARPIVRKDRSRPGRLWLLLVGLMGLLVLGYVIDGLGIWYRSLSERALRQYDPNRALVWVERAVRYAPGDFRSHVHGVRACLQLNRSSSAQDWLSRAARLLGDRLEDEVHRRELEPLQIILAAQNGDQQSAEKLIAWTGSEPLPSEAYEAIIRCAQFNNQLDRADMILNQFQQAGEMPAVVAYHRGRNRELSEEYLKAAEEYALALQLQPTMIRAAFRAGICYSKERDFDAAERVLQKANLRTTLYSPAIGIEIANALWERGKAEQAQQEIERWLDFQPDQLQKLYVELDEFVDIDRAALVAARIADALGKSQHTVELAQRVLAYNHREFESRGLLIKHLTLLNRHEDAKVVAEQQQTMIANRQRARQLRIELIDDSANIDKLCELAELFWSTESAAEAQLVINDVLAIDPQCVRARELLDQIRASRSPTNKL